jgi:hypothetical protein
MRETNKIMMGSGNVCYNSVRNILFPHFMSNNMNIKLYEIHSCRFQWVCHLIFHIERRIQAEAVEERSPKEDI